MDYPTVSDVGEIRVPWSEYGYGRVAVPAPTQPC